MKLGEKIRYFRRKKELTQKKLGILLGFSESNADIRIYQYEAGIRKPSAKLVTSIGCCYAHSGSTRH